MLSEIGSPATLSTPLSAGGGAVPIISPSPRGPNGSPEWDKQVQAFPAATIFHTSLWAKVLENTYRFTPAYIESEVGGVLPLMEVDSWLTGRRGVSLPFSDECVPLIPHPADVKALFQAACAHGRARKWKYIEFRGGPFELVGGCASLRFWGHRLDLAIGEKALLERIDPATIRSVRKAERSGLTIEFSHSIESIRAFYHLTCLTRKRHGVPPQSFEFYRRIFEHVIEPKSGVVVIARHAEIPVAGAVYLHAGPHVTYKFGASDVAFQHLRPNNLVMWSAIARYARDGYTSFDFGRTACDNEGLRRFKKSWGTEERTISYYRYDLAKSEFITGANSSGTWQNAIFSRLPIPLSRMVGAVLYRHIA